MFRSPHTDEEVAQARTVVTHFDAMLHDHGPTEAEDLLDTAWKILLADHAARLVARRRAKIVSTTPGDTTPGDAA